MVYYIIMYYHRLRWSVNVYIIIVIIIIIIIINYVARSEQWDALKVSALKASWLQLMRWAKTKWIKYHLTFVHKSAKIDRFALKSIQN